MDDSNGVWRTVGGLRIFIKNGEDIQDAISRKTSQIAKSKEQATIAEKQSAKSDGFNTTSTKDFPDNVQTAKDTCADNIKWRVDVHTKDEYDEKNAKCFTTKGGSVVAVTKDGDIISVCKNQGDSASGRELLAYAVQKGGVKLDSFSGNHVFYTKCGFEPVSWTPFNREYAPSGWKPSYGEEPVIFYRYVGVGNVKNTSINSFLSSTKPFTGDDGYDNAMRYRDSQL